MAANEQEEDDYMSMSFAEPASSLPATSLSRQQQKRKAAELKSRPKSAAERASDAEKARQVALATSTLDPSNRGAKLMAKLGFKGGALGKTEGARTTPIELQLKDDRGGIGMDSEKKRKIREVLAAQQGREKRAKADEGEFRERNAREREERKAEGQFWGAMKVAEKLDTEAGAEEKPKGHSAENGNAVRAANDGTTPRLGTGLAHINILWRGLARSRLEREKERRLRHELQDHLSRLPGVADREEDEDDKLAMGTEVEELDEEDAELDDFMALEPAEKIKQLVEYLRKTYDYCFWCKYRYPDASLDGCPGLLEDDHD